LGGLGWRVVGGRRRVKEGNKYQQEEGEGRREKGK
jgi:hypothetical protein